MPSNVEIKAHLKDLAGVCKIAEQICTEGPTILQQEDTFFTVDKGRLKLRKIEVHFTYKHPEMRMLLFFFIIFFT